MLSVSASKSSNNDVKPEGQSQPAYDFVLLQELYATWYSDTQRAKFVATMKRNGYRYVALPSAISTFPSMWANSGVAIFSRFPIKDICNR